jgi:branched-chain amino acid transport system ATP-binding protein
MSLLKINKLKKDFGGLTAVSDFDLSIAPGEIVGLIGPNGAGKTTIFNLISGYLHPTAGEILFKEASIVGQKTNQICKKGIGRTFQIVKPFTGLTVLKNVMIGAFNKTDHPDLSEAKSLQVLEFLGLLDKKDFPTGSLTIADRKRLELARSLATQPELLLLDEVAAGLNPKETEDIIALIKKINQGGVTLLMIEHVMKTITSLAKKIVVINYGVKIAEGEPFEVLRDPNVVKAYLGEAYQIAENK